MTNPNTPKSSPQTFGDLYSEIQAKEILTPTEEDVFRGRALEKYGMMGLLAKRKEVIGSNTRNELSGLLSGLPEREQILAKLDPMLPGYIPTQQATKPAETMTKSPRPTPKEAPIDTGGDDLVETLAVAAPAVAATVAGLSAAVVGTGLISEKWWQKTLLEWFTKFKDWIGGLFDENSMLGGLFGGMKEKIMGMFSLIGAKLWIKPKENAPKETLADKAAESSAAKLFVLLKKESSTIDSNLQTYFTHPKVITLSYNQIKEHIQKYESNTADLPNVLWIESKNPQKDGTLILSAMKLYGTEISQNKLSQSSWTKDEWKSEPLIKPLSRISKYIQFLEKIKEKKDKVEIKDFSFSDAIPSIDSVKEFVWEKKEMLIALRERYAWFSPNVLRFLHTNVSTESYDKRDGYLPYKSKFDDTEWDFLNTTLPAYAEKIPKLLWQFSFWDRELDTIIQNYIKTKWITQANMIDIFVLSGWNDDIENMNDWEKSQVTMRLMVMLRGNGTISEKAESYKYFLKIAANVVGKSSTMSIPPGVKSLIQDTMGMMIDIVLGGSKDVLALWLALAQEHPWMTAGIGATVASVLYLAVSITPIGRILITFRWLLMMLGLGGVVWAAFAFAPNGDIIQKSDNKNLGNIEDMAEKLRKK